MNVGPLDLDAEFEIVHALLDAEGRTTAREHLALVRVVAELTGRLIDEGSPPRWIVRYGDQLVAEYVHGVSSLDAWSDERPIAIGDPGPQPLTDAGLPPDEVAP